METYDYIYSFNGDASRTCLTNGMLAKEGNTGFYYLSRKSAAVKNIVQSTLRTCARPSNRMDDQTLFWNEMHKQQNLSRKKPWDHCSASSGYYATPERTEDSSVQLCCLDRKWNMVYVLFRLVCT